jgi:hypothetical protein
MSTEISGQLDMMHIAIVEFRARFMSAVPQFISRIAFLNSTGEPVADAMFGNFSPETWELIKRLEKSIEQDFLRKNTSEENENEGQDTRQADNFRWGRASPDHD